MLQSTILLCLFLLTVSADSINSFHKGTSTTKPDMLFEDSPVSKPRKTPSHISEFTDPDTGLNPFLDLEEGPTSAGRNVMKDERREDPPFFDFELVEGDSTERRWGGGTPDLSKLPVEETLQRWPPFEDKPKEEPSTTIDHSISEVFTTTEKSFKSSLGPDQVKSFIEEQINQDVRTSKPSRDSIIYCSATVVAVAFVALLVGVCWWRRKVKRTTRSHVAVENGELGR